MMISILCTFNSIKVRLKPFRLIFEGAQDLSFNSIKVRLKLIYHLQPHVDFVFQFHKGAIETNTSSTTSLRGSIFQFHKGAIETTATASVNYHQASFNSIKVRLKLYQRQMQDSLSNLSIP